MVHRLKGSYSGAHPIPAYMDAHWSAVERARSSPLFTTPVEHFLVRAFLSEGIDEFLAHLTTIEAALGLPDDYPGGTRRLMARIAAFLGDISAANQYDRLFQIRSCYLHGRRMEEAISSEERMERV
jgi:hypothetical protein